MNTKCSLFCASLLLSVAQSACALEWRLPLTFSVGSSTTSVVIGAADGAGDGFDPALDTPAPADAESLDAYIAHPDWQTTIGGKKITALHQDIRSNSPQSFVVQLKSGSSPVMVTWNRDLLPKGLTMTLGDAAGAFVDMNQVKQHMLPVNGSSVMTVAVIPPDQTAPAPPTGLTVSAGLKKGSLQVNWKKGVEADLAGYRIHIGTTPGAWQRVVDLKNVQNYNIFELQPGEGRYVAVTGYDNAGNESGMSDVLYANLPAQPVDGTCGDSHGTTLTALPQNSLCRNGIASTVSGSGPWSWNCSGEYNGVTAQCSANIAMYTVSFVSGGNGTLSGEVIQTVKHGSTASPVSATATEGFHFDYWSGNGNFKSIINPLAYSPVTSDSTITAHFAKDIKADTKPPVTKASLKGAYYKYPVQVALKSNEPGTIYFTINGSIPTTASPKYTVPVRISKNSTLKFFAVDTAGNKESVKTEVYFFNTGKTR